MAKQLNVDMRFNADTSKAKQAISDLEAALQKLGHGTMPAGAGIDPGKFEQASAAARELEYHLKNAYNAKTGNFDLSKLHQSLTQSGTGLKQLTASFGEAGKVGQQAFISLAKAISVADQPSLTLNTHIQALWTTLKNTARFQISSSLLHGLISGVNSAYRYTQDLNESLNNIRIVTGQNTDQMAKFAEQANKTARALSSSTLDYTNASLIYYQQGLSDDEVKERTDVTIKMANVSRESAETVSEQMTAIWNNFDDGSKSLEYYADVITALGAATASSSSEISTGLEKFAAVADTVGLSYENATAALATITATTRQSADTVGTGLRTLFSRIQGLSLGETLDDGVNLNKYSKALQTVGVQALDASGNLRSMDAILEDLGERWGTLSDAQQTALAQTVGGVRQYTTLIALMDNWDFMKQNQEVAANAEGTLQEQADIYAQGWEAARQRVETAAEGIYDALVDEDFFIQIDKTIEHILTGVKGFIDSFGGIQSILTGVLSFVLQMVSSKIGPAVQKLVQDFAILTGGANQVYQKIQSDFNKAVDEELRTKNYSEQEEQELRSAGKVLAMRTKMAAVNDQLSASEKFRYQLAIDGAEREAKIIQENYEAREKAAEEVKKAEEQQNKAFDKLQAIRLKEADNEQSVQKVIEAELKALEVKENLSKNNLINKKLEAEAAVKATQAVVKEKEAIIEANKEREKTARIAAGQAKGALISAARGKNNINNATAITKAEQILSIDEVTKLNSVIQQTGTTIKEQLINGLIEGNTKSIDLRESLKTIASEAKKFKITNLSELDEAKAKVHLLKDSFSGLIKPGSELSKTFSEIFKAKDVDTFNSQLNNLITQLRGMKVLSKDTEKILLSLGGNPDMVKKLVDALKEEKQASSDVSKAKKELEKATKDVEKATKEYAEVSKQEWANGKEAAEITATRTRLENKAAESKRRVTDAETAYNTAVSNSAEKQKKAKEAAEAYQQSIDKLSITANNFEPQHLIKGSEVFASSIAGLGQTATAINSIMGMVNTWNNTDLTFGEKLVSSFSSLAFLLPSLTGIFTAYGKVMDYVNQTTRQETLATIAQLGAKNLQAGAELKASLIKKLVNSGMDETIAKETTELLLTQGLKEAIEGKTIVDAKAILMSKLKNQALTDEQKAKIIDISLTGFQRKETDLFTLSILKNIAARVKQLIQFATLHPIITGITVAITGLIAALTFYSRREKEITENAQEFNDQQKEKLDKMRQEQEANKALVNSFEETLAIYQKAQETGENLEEAQNNLADAAKAVGEAYNIQGAALAKLTGNYDDFAEAVKKAELKEIEETLGQATTSQEATSAAILREAITGRGRRTLNSSYYANFGSAADFDKVKNIINEGNYKTLGISEEGNIELRTQYTADSIVQAYEEIQDAYNRMAQEIKPETLTRFEPFQNMQEMLGRLKDSYDQYQAQAEEIRNLEIRKIDLTGIIDGAERISSSTIETVEDYNNYRDKLVTEIANTQGIDIADAENAEEIEKIQNAVDAYLGTISSITDIRIKAKGIEDFNAIAGANFDVVDTVKRRLSAEFTNQVSNSDRQKYAPAERVKEFNDAGGIWNSDDYVNKYFDEELELVLQINPRIDPKDWDKEIALLQSQQNEVEIQGHLSIVESAQEIIDNKKKGSSADWVDWRNNMSEEDWSHFLDNTGLTSFTDFLLLSDEDKERILASYKDLGKKEAELAREQEEEDLQNSIDAYDSSYGVSRAKENSPFFNPESHLNLSNLLPEDQQSEINTDEEYVEALRLAANLQQQRLTNEKDLSKEEKEAIQSDVDALNDEANAIQNVIDLQEQRKTKLAQMQNEDEATAAYGFYDDLVEEINQADLEVEDVKEYAEYLKDIGEFSENDYNTLKDLQRESLEFAFAVQKLDKGLNALANDGQTWLDTLNTMPKASNEVNKAVNNLGKALSDITGLDADFFDYDWLTNVDNQQIIEDVINGVDGAVKELQSKIGKERLNALEIPVNVDRTTFQNDFDNLKSLYDDFVLNEFPDLEFGASIDDTAFYSALTAMLNNAEISIADMNEILSGFGMEVETEEITLPQNYEVTQLQSGEVFDVDGQKYTYAGDTSLNVSGGSTVTVLKGTKYKGGGKPSSSKSGGGGGGGGGGKTKSKEKKDPTDDKDRYHTITEKISDATNAYDELSKAEDRAFGKERVDAMKGMTDNLKLQIELQKQYLDEIRDYLVGDRAAVEALGATFDANGVITNYDALIDELVAKYNEGVDAFNAGTVDEDAFKEQYEEPFNKAKEAIDQYVETINLLQDEELNLIDLQNDLADELREIAAYKLELHIDLDEDELQYLDFLLEMLGDKAEDAADRLDLLGQQFNTNRDEISAYTTAIQDLLRLRGFTDDDVAAFIRGELTVGDLEERGFTTDDIDKLREYRDAIQDNTEAMNDLAQEIEDSFLDTLDELNDKVDDAEDRFNHFADMLEHFQNVVDIVGQDTLGMSAETMELLARQAKDNAIEMVEAARTQLDSLDTVRSQAEAQLAAALEAQKNASSAEEKLRADEAVRYWSDTISEVTTRVEEAEKDLADALENALEGIKDMYTVMIEQTTKDFERSITGAAGSLEQLQNNFDKQKETQDLYIPAYEKIYELSKLTRDINNSIDDTDNLWSKQELAKLQDEINDKMADGVELTEHDVEELRKRYELKLAEAALEEAQSAKRTVRMSRDNEGNWSYVYTADEDDVAAAEQNYEDKLFQYQQMNYEYIQELQSNILQAEQDMTDAINDLDVTKFASKEAYLAEVQRIMDATMAKEQQYKDQLAQTLDQQGILYDEDWKRYNELTGYRMARDDQWVDNWDETILAQETGFDTLDEMFNELVNAIGGPDNPGSYVGDITDAYAEMQAANERALNAADTSMQTYEQDVVNSVDNIDNAMEQTQDRVDEFSNSMVETMEGVSDFIGEWKNQYGDAVKSITEFNKDLYDSCNTLIKKLQDTFQVNADFEAAQAAAAEEALAGNNRGAVNTVANNETVYNEGPGYTPQDECPRGGNHNWVHINTSMATGDQCTKCGKRRNWSERKVNFTNGIASGIILGGDGIRTGSVASGIILGGDGTRKKITMKSGGYTGTWSAASGRTGMYTGSWNGPDLEENGRLAFLHQKELVLNANDTENFLSAIDMVRQISSMIDLQAASRSSSLGLLLPGIANKEPETLDQNVHIEAHFPNVTSHSEIEEAFTNLVGKASQFANR